MHENGERGLGIFFSLNEMKNSTKNGRRRQLTTIDKREERGKKNLTG